jgi:hypothetical protein
MGPSEKARMGPHGLVGRTRVLLDRRSNCTLRSPRLGDFEKSSAAKNPLMVLGRDPEGSPCGVGNVFVGVDPDRKTLGMWQRRGRAPATLRGAAGAASIPEWLGPDGYRGLLGGR